MTYKRAFFRLWQIRRRDRPEDGLARQLNFSIKNDSEKSLGISTQYEEQQYKVGSEQIEHWHERFALKTINQTLSRTPTERSELENRFVTALLYFKAAGDQKLLEMQLPTLWVCIELFLTVGTDTIVKANVDRLVAYSVMLHSDYWPQSADSPESLRKVLAKFYGYRSKTLHHGQRDHVSRKEAQDFAMIVASFLVVVAWTIDRGFTKRQELRDAADQWLADAGLDFTTEEGLQ